MKYIVNVKEKSIAHSLNLPKAQADRINKAIESAFDQVQKSNLPDFSFDEVISHVAPHLNTPEEAFYGAMILNEYLMKAMSGLNTSQ